MHDYLLVSQSLSFTKGLYPTFCKLCRASSNQTVSQRLARFRDSFVPKSLKMKEIFQSTTNFPLPSAANLAFSSDESFMISI